MLAVAFDRHRDKVVVCIQVMHVQRGSTHSL